MQKLDVHKELYKKSNFSPSSIVTINLFQLQLENMESL